jgi:hypothetical protein
VALSDRTLARLGYTTGQGSAPTQPAQPAASTSGGLSQRALGRLYGGGASQPEPEQPSILRRAAGAVGDFAETVGEFVPSPIKAGLQAAGALTGKLGETFLPDAYNRAYEQNLQSIDKDGDPDAFEKVRAAPGIGTTIAEAISPAAERTPGWGNAAATVGALVGDIATDPTTYLTGSLSAAGKLGRLALTGKRAADIAPDIGRGAAALGAAKRVIGSPAAGLIYAPEVTQGIARGIENEDYTTAALMGGVAGLMGAGVVGEARRLRAPEVPTVAPKVGPLIVDPAAPPVWEGGAPAEFLPAEVMMPPSPNDVILDQMRAAGVPDVRAGVKRPDFLNEGLDEALPPGPELGYGRGGVPVERVPPPPIPSVWEGPTPPGMDAPLRTPDEVRADMIEAEMARTGPARQAEADAGMLASLEAERARPVSVRLPEWEGEAADAGRMAREVVQQQSAVPSDPRAASTDRRIATESTATERRIAARRDALRQRIAQEEGLAPESKAVERILNAELDPKTGLWSKPWFDRVIETHTGGIGTDDLGGLKWVNDNLGHPAGDAMIEAKAASLLEAAEEINARNLDAGLEAARPNGGGDEGAILGATQEVVNEAYALAREKFNKRVFRIDLPDGTSVRYTGGVLDYGTAAGTGREGFKQADAALLAGRAEAEARGERVRGAKPPSLQPVEDAGAGAGDLAPIVPEPGIPPVRTDASAGLEAGPRVEAPVSPETSPPPLEAPPAEVAPKPAQSIPPKERRLFDREAAIKRLQDRAKKAGGQTNVGANAVEGVAALRDAAIIGASYGEEYARNHAGKFPDFESWARVVGRALSGTIENVGKFLRQIYDEAVGLFRGKTPEAAARPAEAPPAEAAVPPLGAAAEAPPADATPQARTIDVPAETRVETVQRKLQDKMNRVGVVQEAVKKSGGAITEDTDVKAAADAFSSKASERLADVKRRYVEPLTQTLGKQGLTLDHLDDYLYAKHAVEANPILAGADQSGRDGLSGMSTADAQKILTDLDTQGITPKLAEAERLIRSMEEERLKILVDGGLESPETIAAWKAKWGSNYVPFSTADAEALMGTGRGFDIRGKESKQRLGRTTRADSPTSFIQAQLQRAITRAEKNKVDQKFAELVRQNPDPKLWAMDVEHTKREMGPDGKVRSGADHKAYTDDFHYKVNGEEKRITVKDPLLLKAMQNLGPQESNELVRMVGNATRAYSKLVTTLNPEFVFTNFTRDAQSALANLGAESGAKVATSAAKKVWPAGKALWRVLKDPNADGPMEQYAREFRADGGAVEWLDAKNVKDIEAELRSKISREGPGATKAAFRVAGKLTDAIGRANKSVENASRLAAYVALREAGVDRAKAATAARNLTVDFTKKGEWGPALNSFYAFVNANVQGTKRLKEVVVDNPTGRKIAAGLMGMGAVMDQYNRTNAGDANDDGTNDYDAIPEHVKSKNIVIMTGKGSKPLLIPMPYGFNVLFSAGRLGSSVSSGASSPAQAGSTMASTAWNAFNPIGDESLVGMLTPTLLDPFVQDTTNKDFAGKPIRPEPFPGQPPKPDSQTFFRNVNPLAKDLAFALNRATGGDKVTPGYVDVSPETVMHYWNFATGGLGRFIGNTAAVAESLAKGEAPELRNTPVARRFAYEEQPGAANKRYRENLMELEQLEERYEHYGKERDRKGLASISRPMLTAKRAVSQIDRQIRAIRKLGRPDADKKIEALQNRANKIVEGARRAPTGGTRG